MCMCAYLDPTIVKPMGSICYSVQVFVYIMCMFVHIVYSMCILLSTQYRCVSCECILCVIINRGGGGGGGGGGAGGGGGGGPLSHKRIQPPRIRSGPKTRHL
jgi:uncharacterized membrane protein YgcG